MNENAVVVQNHLLNGLIGRTISYRHALGHFTNLELKESQHIGFMSAMN